MARGASKAELEAEVEKLREYKVLTKLRMKQAAEKLASYRVQLEECQATVESLKETVASQHQKIDGHEKTIRALSDKVAALEASESTSTEQPQQTTAQPTQVESAAPQNDPWESLASSSDESDSNDAPAPTLIAAANLSLSSSSSSSSSSDDSDMEDFIASLEDSNTTTQPDDANTPRPDAVTPSTTPLVLNSEEPRDTKQAEAPTLPPPDTVDRPVVTAHIIARPTKSSEMTSPTATTKTSAKPVPSNTTLPHTKTSATPVPAPATAAPTASTRATVQPLKSSEAVSLPTDATPSHTKTSAAPVPTPATATPIVPLEPSEAVSLPTDATPPRAKHSARPTPSPRKRPMVAAESMDDAPSPKVAKTESSSSVPVELVVLNDTLQKAMSKQSRPDLVVQAYMTALRTLDSPPSRALCLAKTVKNLVQHHQVPVADIADAVLRVGTKSASSMDTSVCVDLLWHIAHPRRADLLTVLHSVATHVKKPSKRPNVKVQATWCRVHTLLCRRASWAAASRSFLVDRLAEVSRSIWDFVAIAQSWPHVVASIGSDTNEASLLPATIRFLLSGLYHDEAAKNTEIAAYFEELKTLCQLDPPLADSDYLDTFRTLFDRTTFETCQSVRLLLRVRGWSWCAEHDVLPHLADGTNTELSPTELRVLGVAASVFVTFGATEATLINQAKQIGELLMRVVADGNVDAAKGGDGRVQVAAATALVDVALSVPTKGLRAQYLASVLRWFQTQPTAWQLSQPTVFLRQLHQVAAMA